MGLFFIVVLFILIIYHGIKDSVDSITYKNMLKEKHKKEGGYPIYYDTKSGTYRNIYTNLPDNVEYYWEQDLIKKWEIEKEKVLKENPKAIAACTHGSKRTDQINGTVYKKITNPNVDYFKRTFCWWKDDFKRLAYSNTHSYLEGCCQAEFYMDRNGKLVAISDDCRKYLEEHNWSAGEKGMKYYGEYEDIIKFMNYVNKKQDGKYGYVLDYNDKGYQFCEDNYNKRAKGTNAIEFYMNAYSS